MADGTTLAQQPRSLPLILRYTAFALFAAALNLLLQMTSMALYQGPQALLLAMCIGTIGGIVPKFLLDKYWIFYDREKRSVRGLRQFILYGLLSVATTLLFWIFELAFRWLGDSGPLRYIGAGLGLGYWAKYHLDRQLVFDGR